MLFASIIAARSLIIFSLEIYENGSLLMSDLKKCMVKKKKQIVLRWLSVTLE